MAGFPTATSKSGSKSGGGCGCRQKGGSLASDAVVKLVGESAWSYLNSNQTNKFEAPAAAAAPAQKGGAGKTSLVTGIAQMLKVPLTTGGGQSFDDMIRSSLAGPLKAKYSKTMKKYSAALSGGGNDAFAPIESLSSLISPDFSSIVSRLSARGGADLKRVSANDVLDQLTPAGAAKLADLLHDPNMLKSGKSVASYAKLAAKLVASDKAKALATKLKTQHGGAAFDIALSLSESLSKANLDKMALLAGHGPKAGAAFLESLQNGKAGGGSSSKAAAKKKAPLRG